MAEELGMRMRLDGVVETTNGIKLVGDETDRTARKLDIGSKALDGMGMSAKQTRQAMRELPMQFTDIATSLAGGMPAWLVFVQQGGQIRDRFGGALPALRAIGSMITPLTVAAGGAAAGLGILALAMSKGASEAQEMNKSVILTGYSFGMTADHAHLMARALATVKGTVGENSEAMAALASTGLVGARSLELATRAAVALERAAGVALKDTVRQFSELGKDPVKAAARLNESTNFLTKSLFDQIFKLKEQGRESEAAALAQNAYADVVVKRSAEIEKRLGVLPQVWKAVGDSAALAWDKMMNVGRSDDAGQKLTKVRAEMDAILKSSGGQEPGAITASAMRLTALRTQEMLMVGQIRAESEKAKSAAEEAAVVRNYVDKKLNPGAAKKKEFPGAIRVGTEQYKSDFLRSEAKAYDDINEALQKVSEAERKRAADQEASFATWYANEQAKALLQEQKDAEKAAEKAATAWEKTRRDEEEQMQRRTEKIADSIYEGIVNGFREGQGPADIFIRELKAQFARTVLRIPVEFASRAMSEAGDSLAGALLGIFTGIGGYSTVDPDGAGIPADLIGNPQDRRANGGATRSRGMFEVAEEGPEMLRVGNRSFLMMGNKDGYVHSASATRAMGGGGRSVSFNPTINIDARTDQAQVHQLVVRAMQVAQSDLLQKMDRGEV